MEYNYIEERKYLYRKASFTVESTFVMVITIWVIMILIYGSMYIHDSVVMRSVLRLRLQQGDLEEKEVKADMKKKMFLVQCDTLKYKKGILSDKITLYYHVTITNGLIQKILMNGQKTGQISVEKEKGNGAVLMWDATVIGDD